MQPCMQQAGAAQTCSLPLDAIVLQQGPEHAEHDIHALRRLAASIRREGLREPLTVEPYGMGRYRLLDGRKRLQACRMIGMTHAEVVIIQPQQRPMRTVGEMLDALMGGRLHYLDQARMLHRLESEFGLRSDVLSGMLGISADDIARRLTLLSLEEPLQAYLVQSGLPETIAYQLMRLPAGDMRMQLAQQAARGKLGVRDVDLLVRSMLMHAPQQERTISLVRDYRLYANAIRSLTDQMQASGVAASYDEQREGATLVITVKLPIRRRRMLPADQPISVMPQPLAEA